MTILAALCWALVLPTFPLTVPLFLFAGDAAALTPIGLCITASDEAESRRELARYQKERPQYNGDIPDELER